MASKNTTLLGFRFPLKYIEVLDERVEASGRSRASWCRWALNEHYNEALELAQPIVKLPFYDKVKRERSKLSGKSIVITVRLPHELAQGIRELAQRDGNNVSEWLGMAVFKVLC